MRLNDAVRRRLGKLASAYVEEYAILSRGGTVYLVADRYETPRGVERTLTRVYGRARVPGDGETAYWEIDRGNAVAASEAH